MSSPAPLPSFAAIVVAAGKGLRAGQDLPKQFASWRGKPVLRHSVETLSAAGANPLVIAIPQGFDDQARKSLEGIPGVELVTGGATRQASVAAALDRLATRKPERVLIHDAARPDLPQAILESLLFALTDHTGAIPVLPVVDSLVIAKGDLMTGTAERESLRRVQTPQAFRFAAIHKAHGAWTGPTTAGDDAQVLAANGGTVVLVEGSEALRKLTFAEDFDG